MSLIKRAKVIDNDRKIKEEKERRTRDKELKLIEDEKKKKSERYLSYTEEHKKLVGSIIDDSNKAFAHNKGTIEYSSNDEFSDAFLYWDKRSGGWESGYNHALGLRVDRKGILVLLYINRELQNLIQPVDTNIYGWEEILNYYLILCYEKDAFSSADPHPPQNYD